MKQLLALLTAAMLLLAALSGCAGNGNAGDGDSGAAGSNAGSTDAGTDSGTVKIGLVTAITGSSSYIGELGLEGANLAVEEINAAGGVNGQQLELVVADEVDNVEMSVLATQELLANDEIMGIVGSVFSAYCLTAMPAVEEAGVPFLCLGSSSAVSAEKNPYTWQVRPLDSVQGQILADFVVNELGCTNPAIMYSTTSTYAALFNNTRTAFEELGVTIPESSVFAFPEDESNYSPYISQVLDGGFDCLVAMTNQAPAALVCQQAAAAGLTSEVMPLVGCTSYAADLCISNAGGTADGWYSVSDWAPGGNSEAGTAFEEAYLEAYPERESSDLNSVSIYDAVYILAEAMKLAGTNTDREAINTAMQELDFDGAMGHFSYHDDHSFASSLFVTQNVDNKPSVITAITYR